MGALRFRLQPLLDRKKEIKQAAETVLMQKQRELAAEQATLEAARRRELELIER